MAKSKAPAAANQTPPTDDELQALRAEKEAAEQRAAALQQENKAITDKASTEAAETKRELEEARVQLREAEQRLKAAEQARDREPVVVQMVNPTAVPVRATEGLDVAPRGGAYEVDGKLVDANGKPLQDPK